MEGLFIEDIHQIIVDATHPPLMAPTPESVGPMECPVCLEYKPTMMLSHKLCMRLICASCILPLLETLNEVCPICKKTVRKYDFLNAESEFCKPPPNDQYWMDQVKYKCEACNEELEIEPAKTHHLNCPGDVRTQNVRPKHPRGLVPLTRKEVISNPVSHETPLNTSRLAIYHFNGVQLLARMVNVEFTVLRLKQAIAKLTKKDVNNIQMIKHVHKVLDDSDRFGDVSTTDGATFISCYTDEPGMKTKTVNLIFEEVGMPPITDEQRAEQIQTRRRREQIATTRRSNFPPPTLTRRRFVARTNTNQASSTLDVTRRRVRFQISETTSTTETTSDIVNADTNVNTTNE